MEDNAITAVAVKGFKSFAEEQRIEIRPLTLLAGANSSGKSSAMQPLLLLKQTLDNSFDPGPLLLDGPHLKFSSANQVLTRGLSDQLDEFEVEVEVSALKVREKFRKRVDENFDLTRLVTTIGDSISLVLEPGMTRDTTLISLGEILIGKLVPKASDFLWKVFRDRCFLGITSEELLGINIFPWTVNLAKHLRSIIHVPGFRGNPEREYRTVDTPEYFQGTFENYAASVISGWQRKKDERLGSLDAAMRALGLAGKVTAKPMDAIRVELLVSRRPGPVKSSKDLVNIADVGFGVSQVLPVLVALLAAEPGQLVYLEQPELHLHPRAQQALARILADAAQRGVRVVAETHSSILLLAVQALVAEGKLASDLVKLHWFTRGANGATKVTSADLDRLGAYGDWPEDFGEVQAEADNRYLDAVESAVRKPSKNARKKTARR